MKKILILVLLLPFLQLSAQDYSTKKAQVENNLLNLQKLLTMADTSIIPNEAVIELKNYSQKFIDGIHGEKNGYVVKFKSLPENVVCLFECSEFATTNKIVIIYNLNAGYDFYNSFALAHEFIHIKQAMAAKETNSEICPTNQTTHLSRENSAWTNEYFILISIFREMIYYRSDDGYTIVDRNNNQVVVNPYASDLIRFRSDPKVFLKKLYSTSKVYQN